MYHHTNLSNEQLRAVLHKALNFLVFTILASFLMTFVLAAFYEHTKQKVLLFLYLFIISVTMWGIFQFAKRIGQKTHLFEHKEILIAACTFGAVLTHVLNVDAGLGAVISASLAGLLASLLGFLKNKQVSSLPPAIYCGAFVGMSSPLVLSNILLITIAGFVAGILYSLTPNVLVGAGGKLGTMAFIGTVTVTLLFYILK